jgi:acyl carrier protein
MSYHTNIDEAKWAKVRDAFAAALGLEDDEVELGSKLISDLGAESLDFLDIVYRLERAFDIKIPRGGIEGSAQEEVGGTYEVDGILTDDGLMALKQLMPEVPSDEFHDGMRVTEVPELFRVATFYNLVCHLIEKADQAKKASEDAG